MHIKLEYKPVVESEAEAVVFQLEKSYLNPSSGLNE